MSKRDRHLKQRLDELFSSPPEPAETPPEAQAAELAPSSIERAAAAAPELPYLKAMIDQLPLPAYLKNREHTWVAVNTLFAQLIGHTPETLLGHTDKEQADKAWQLDDRVLDSGQSEEVRETSSLPDGKIRIRCTRRTPLLTTGQDVHYVMCVVEDSVAAAPAEVQSLATATADENMFRDLFENTDALIQSVQNDGTFVFSNRAWRKALGYSEEELAQLNLFDVIHPDSQPHCRAIFQQIMEGKHVQQIEAKFIAKDGHTIDVEGSTSCSFKDGRPVITQGVFHDVSQRKHLEHDLQRLLAIESKRAVQLQTATEVSKAAGTFLNVDELLPFVVNLIQQRFTLYYVGLFLVDDARQNAVLRAGTGEAGQIMLDRHHQLPLDDRSMIGWCIQRQMPRIALDVGKDAVHFNNPNLPDTRSELALPLVSRGRVLGAVTVQSTEAAAFGEQDIAILQTMCDQLATAIANAQLFEQASQARQQAEVRLRETQFLQSVGQTVSSSLDLSSVLEVVLETLQRGLGFTHNAVVLVDKQAETVSIPRASGTAAGLQGLTRSVEQLQNDILMDVLRTGQIEVIDGWDDRFDRQIYESQGHAELVRAFVPLRLRGESIGLLEVGYRRAERARITPEEIRLLGSLADQIAIAVGNARQFDETQRRITELQTLNDISQLVVSQHELTTLLLRAGEKVLQIFKVNTGFVALYEEQTQTISFPFYMHEGQSTQVARRQLGKGLASYVIEHRQPLLIRQLTPELLTKYGAFMTGTGELQQSWLGVPIMVGNAVLGVLNVQDYSANQFGDDAVRLLGTIAGTIGIAIQSAQLFEETRTRAEERAALYDMSQVLASHLNVDQVLQEVYHGVSRLLDTSNFFIGLYSPEQNRVSFPVSIAEAHQDEEIEEISADQGLTGYVIRTKAPLLIREGLPHWEEEHGISPVGELAASWLGVPLLVGQQVLGIMAVQSYSGSHLYDEHDRDLLMAIANQAAIALQNARLFERTQQNARELAALNEFGQTISQQLEIEQVLEVAYQRLQQLLPIDTFFAALYDHPSDMISFPVIYDEGKRYSEPPFPFNTDSSTGQVILTGEPILELLTLDELAALTEVEGALGNVERPSASLLYVPLRVGPLSIGTLSIQSYHVNAYNQDTVQLVSNIANQVAIAIQNARLFNEVRQRSTELAALNQIIGSATQTLDLHALLDTVLRQTLDLFGFDGGLITIFNIDRQKLERIVRAGLPGQIPADPAEGLENSLCTYVFNSRLPLVIEDFREGAPIDVSGEIEAGYYSYIGVPLEARGRRLGTWCGFRKIAGLFDKNTLPLLQAVSYQIGFAIDNARLFEQTQRAARREHTLREITSRVRNSADPDAIARTAVRELGLALGRKTFIRLGDAEQLGKPPQPDQEVPASGNGHNASPEGGQ